MNKNKLSVIIICKNAVSTIDKAISSAKLIADDIVVIDSGSTDGTIEKIINTNAKLIKIEWQGYGAAKNTGNNAAVNNWVFSLDADEFIGEDLATTIQQLDLTNSNIVYSMKRLNYLGNKAVKFGEWRNDFVTRLFNKKIVTWDVSPVHEQLIFNAPVVTHTLKGLLHHYTSADINLYKSKLENYAHLSAEKYFNKNKKTLEAGIYLSPAFNFIKNYFFKSGFLDGKEGLQIAKAHAWYTYKKYFLLRTKRKHNSNK